MMMIDAPSPNSKSLPAFQIAWDSTSLGWLKTCPQLYAYQREGWTTKARSIHLVFGGLYASGVERYAHARASGASHDTACIAVVRWVLENAGHRDTEGQWHPWTPDPTSPDASTKNLYTLIRSLIWNFEDRLGTPFSTLILANGKPAVELTFNFDFAELHGETISLSGHLDEVVEYEGGRYVKDDKTTKGALDANYRSHYSPDNQMSLYSIAGRVILDAPIKGVLVRATQVGVNFNRYATFIVPRPKAVLDEWMADTLVWIKHAREYAEANHWPKNDKSCHLCAFKSVCSVSPAHRRSWLESDFIKQPPWNPLAARGL